MIEVFSSPPNFAIYNGDTTSYLAEYFTNTSYGGSSFTVWEHNNMTLPTEEWIKS